MKSPSLVLQVLFIAGSILAAGRAAPQASSAEQWALMGREGDCYPIATLKLRLADMPDVRDPDAFERYVKARGWPYTRSAHPVNPGKAIKFAVESQGLSLLFVTVGLCGSTPASRR